MEIVENKHERCLLRRVPEECRYRVEQAEPCALGLEVVQLLDIGEELAQIRQEMR